MRTQQILNVLSANLNLNITKTAYFSTNGNFRGGWEAWLQANIAYAFQQANQYNRFTREEPYPSSSNNYNYLTYQDGNIPQSDNTNNGAAAARADFLIQRTQGIIDPTYLELKCYKSTENLGQAWDRFKDDCTKINTLYGENDTLNCAALLATYGTFSQNAVKGLDWYWGGDRTARVLDYSPGLGQAPLQTTLANVATGGNDRQFIVCVGM